MNKKYILILIGSLIVLAIAVMFVASREVTANWPALRTGQQVASSSVPVALSSLVIPEGLNLVIKAKTTNTNKVTLGYSTTTALNTGADHFSLYPGESIELNLTNANLLYFDVVVNDEGIEYIVETDY